jgi:hypothetical protein
MSPEPLEHSKTIIYLKSNNSITNNTSNTNTNSLKDEKGREYQDNNSINSTKTKRGSVYSSEKDTTKERIQKIKIEMNNGNSNSMVDTKTKSNTENNKIKLNSIRSISSAVEISAKRIKKDNNSHEKSKDNKNMNLNLSRDEISKSSNELKEQNTFVKSEEYKKCEFILRRMKKHKYGGPFLEPVDPVALNIPT